MPSAQARSRSHRRHEARRQWAIPNRTDFAREAYGEAFQQREKPFQDRGAALIREYIARWDDVGLLTLDSGGLDRLVVKNNKPRAAYAARIGLQFERLLAK
ncbi:hypothetical protein FJV76_28040 [Mesorhizobium sp. WSM4303]|uniref:hypothetical protein n=1 Tax=unclassified Mesorhizobium TaxID=325217 RepID=UPI00115EF75A|nr:MULTISPECIES: hypothetical protein [unclassified Mesorhizobium]TRC96902.1 hypothetical protein FJV76_28040 [Mesorhizobium sp. WSM4303]TRD00705.1 hypothetical protein FJV77_02410 [Mesorhizobium sp. WSM4306]